MSANRMLTPEGSNTFISRPTVAPYMRIRGHDGLAAIGQRAENRDVQRRHAGGAGQRAASPPSSAHINSSSAASVGLS